MGSRKKESQLQVVLEMYDQAYTGRAWHGTNLRGSLKGVKLAELLWRPQANRHNIWEIAVHCAYWKYVALRRITNGKKNEFPRKPSDWPKLPEKPKIGLWKEELALLESYHVKLRDAIESFQESKFRKTLPKSKLPYNDLMYGVASHDLYHAGQIQLIKRMYRNKQ